MKFCKDCKHCEMTEPNDPSIWVCGREYPPNPVTGEPRKMTMFCEVERGCEYMADGRKTCGPDGAFWKAVTKPLNMRFTAVDRSIGY